VAARGFTPAAAARHPKFEIPAEGGFLHCIDFRGSTRGWSLKGQESKEKDI